jgi:negative regulator of sigma E activity
MKPLESRKQLLIAESELNRAQLVQEWRTMKGEVHALAEQAKTIRSIASAVATLVAGLSNCRNKSASPAAEKPSWLQTILKGAGVVSTFWQSFRASEREPTDK